MNAFDELFKRYPVLISAKSDILLAFDILVSSIKNGGKLLFCGNGGSASDAEHIVGELLKGFMLARTLTAAQQDTLRQACPDDAEFLIQNLQQSIPAISLVSGVAINTAVANDTNPQFIFAQQLYGLGNPGDVLFGITTSGNSKNIIIAAQVAKAKGLKVIGLTGETGGKLKAHADVCIRVPAKEVAHVQEFHLPVYHALCWALELELCDGKY